ncbi:MAG: CRISPR system precrRNA processing endoribonuclease RAMP protein Cas6 [Thermaerobacter sp.]|jgi:hypothetical protein|nr:CRISPR system precrRNA processing endoribonuclease RAMP protein Cas6 [Thermaerobacter sp.]
MTEKLFPRLSFERYEFRLILRRPLALPEFAGAVFRGAFGYAFRRTACLRPGEECSRCLLAVGCPYAYVFETPHPERLGELPHPFVLQPPPPRPVWPAGEELPVGVVLVGRGAAHLPYFIYAFQEMGRRGLGPERVPFLLTAVRAEGDGREVFRADRARLEDPGPGDEGERLQGLSAGGTAAVLEFLTPLRLRQEGRMVDRLEFPAFFKAAVRRLRALSYYHCGGEPRPELDRVFEAARGVRWTAEDAWRSCQRFSTRQHAGVALGGVTGRLTLSGLPGEVWPVLRLAERLHVGKASSFGLGRFRIETTGG